MSGFFNLLAVSTTLTMTKNHSQQRQSSPQHTLSLRSSLPLASPLLPSFHYRCCSHYRCCLGSFLPYTSTATSPLPPLLHRCCLAHVYPSLSSSSFSPLLYPHFHSSLATPSLPHQILFVSPSALSPNFPSSLHPSFHPLLTFPLHLPELSFSFLFPLCPSLLFLPPHPQFFRLTLTSRPDVFCTETVSPSVIMKLKESRGKRSTCCFRLGGSCHSHTLTARVKKATHTVTQAVFVCICGTHICTRLAKVYMRVCVYSL